MAIPLTADSHLSMRPLVEDDMEFLWRLYSTTRDDIAQLPLSDEQKIQFLNHQFQAQHSHYQRYFSDANFDIVLSGETRVGRLYVEYGTTEIRIIDIAILPEFRGNGIGSKLLREILERAELEKMPVRLRVEPNNPALQWYTRLGFKKIADEQINWHLEWISSEGQQD
jgi:ribosomal protein S18 acetylase RimI-like enzyme